MNRTTKMVLIIGGIIVAVLIIVPEIIGAISGWGYGYGMMGPGMMGGFGGMGLMWIVWILVIGLIVWAVVTAGRGSNQSTGTSSDSALEILKKRYARGEITKQEYEERKKDLL